MKLKGPAHSWPNHNRRNSLERGDAQFRPGGKLRAYTLPRRLRSMWKTILAAGNGYTALPISVLGTEYVTLGDRFRYVAAHDQTHVQVNGSAAATLNRGEFAEQVLSAQLYRLHVAHRFRREPAKRGGAHSATAVFPERRCR
jgi:hypothetical protein